jgi:RimJ/RimL family protein N-acetyltransferase
MYQSWEYPSVASIRLFIEELADLDPDTPGSWYQIGIVLRETERLIGDCGIHVPATEPRQAEVGLSLAPSYQRRGLATEALNALLGYLFGTRGKHRVIGSTDPQNVASIAMMRRVGMRQEASFVESLWFKGEWVDDLLFAILKREWSSSQG